MEGLCPCGHEPTGSIVPVSQLVSLTLIPFSVLFFLIYTPLFRVLHCSNQCYSSSTPRPFSSCAVFAFISSTDGKWVPFSTLFTLVYRKKSQGAKSANMEDVEVFECVYWEETSRAKERCEVGHCPDAASRTCSIRDSAASSTRFVTLSLC